ncbi:MAG TPA: sugar phosphate isomerase/epimerase [Bacteroidales bacterium]|nr:sugar phosphate isomerase/epimerase [Bacteroidales bacterium]HPT01549.1 sugar phosphate isomerase/epimerase [Bacteroidales bacterium]
MPSRRNFLKAASLGAFSLTGLSREVQARPDRKSIGLQLYTVRDYTEKDLTGTLKSLSETGYDFLEAASYSSGKFYGMEPKTLRKLVEGFGMKMNSSHAGFNDKDAALAIESHAELGVKYLVLPSMHIDTPDAGAFMKAAARFNNLGEQCRKAGLKFGYHNHSFEFSMTDRGPGYDVLLNNTDPDLVLFQADLFWMKKAGYNPVDYFKKYPGRFELWHVKDMAGTPEKEDTEVGTGIIDFGELFEKKKLSGMKHFYIENDNPHGDSLESVALSYHNLLNLLSK